MVYGMSETLYRIRAVNSKCEHCLVYYSHITEDEVDKVLELFCEEFPTSEFVVEVINE